MAHELGGGVAAVQVVFPAWVPFGTGAFFGGKNYLRHSLALHARLPLRLALLIALFGCSDDPAPSTSAGTSAVTDTYDAALQHDTDDTADGTTPGIHDTTAQDTTQDTGLDAHTTGDIAAADAPHDTAPPLDTSTSTDAGTTDTTSLPMPTCSTPSGAPGVAFAPLSGKHLHAAKTPMNPGKSYTMGLVALEAGGHWLAEHGGTIYRSTDAGCTWKDIGKAPSSVLRMRAGPDNEAWAFYDNGATLLHIKATTVTTVTAPISNIIGLGTDRGTGAVALGDKLGQIYVGSAGQLWQKSGKAAVGSGYGYRVAFAPDNLDVALYGAMQSGLWWTVNRGKLWAQSTFKGAMQPAKINGMNAVFSTVDPNVVWAMAIDLTEGLQAPSKTNGKYIWRSVDGGKTFEKAVGHLSQADVTITNGVHLAPDAVDKHVVRWAFGTCFSGYGTNLYRYDAAAKGTKLTWLHHPIAGIDELRQHPADPTLLVLGLRGDDNPQCP